MLQQTVPAEQLERAVARGTRLTEELGIVSEQYREAKSQIVQLKLTVQSQVVALKEAQETSAREHAKQLTALQTKLEHLEAQLFERNTNADRQQAKSAEQVASLKAVEQKLQDKLQVADRETTGMMWLLALFNVSS